MKIKTIFGSHQIYQELVNNPPKGIKYLGVSKNTEKGQYYQDKSWKEKLNKLSQKLKLPRIYFIRKGNFDLIHTSRGIIPIQIFSNKPWVMDIEYFSSFIGLHFDIMTRNKFVRFIVKNRLESKNCKKILCHCEATKNSFLKYFSSKKIESKLEIVYPSSHLVNFKKKSKGKIRFFIILSLFTQKGGYEILEAFSNLEKKYSNIELWIKGDVPEATKKKFSSKKIKIFQYKKDIIPRDKLLEKFYFNSDILIYTTFCDSFGYSLIDGLVSGIPIITTNLFASPEIVQNNKNGFILEIPKYNKEKFIPEFDLKKWGEIDRKKFIASLENAMEKLIKSKALRKKMGRESLNLIKSGKFSLKNRNKKLKKIYQEALK